MKNCTLFIDFNNLIVIIAIKVWGKYNIYFGLKYGESNVGFFFPLIHGCISLFLPEYLFECKTSIICEKVFIY